jgi:hypothetical protein
MIDVVLVLLRSLISGLQFRRLLWLENVALRHQLAVLSRQRPRPRLGPADRLFRNGCPQTRICKHSHPVAGDLVFYQFSRWKVEQGFFSHFLSLYAFDKLPAGRRLREMMNCLVLCVDGYDQDEREIHTVPEVRAMIANPIYARFGPYPQSVPDDQWVRCATLAIREDGADQFLVNMLDMLRQTFETPI